MLDFLEHHLFQILRRFENQSLPLDLFLASYFRDNHALGSHDRRFLAERVYGMERNRILLDYLAGAEAKNIEKRVALYQRLPSEPLAHLAPALRMSVLPEFFTLLVEQYGEAKGVALCEVNNTQAPTTIRINPWKTTREALLEAWRGLYDVEVCESSALGIRFKKRIAFFELPEFKKGYFEVQDEGSQLVAFQVKVAPKQQVLDYCAGSGGKTLAFASQMGNRGQIYLHDVRKIALEQARKRLLRAGIQNAQLLEPLHPQLEKLKKKCDWVLADVPCSGSGTYRRNPDMKAKFSSERLYALVGEQRRIFEQALSYCKTGGRIVYATCSLLAAENEEQMAHFLKTYPLEMEGEPFVSLPTFGGMDGFFAVTFRKS